MYNTYTSLRCSFISSTTRSNHSETQLWVTLTRRVEGGCSPQACTHPKPQSFQPSKPCRNCNNLEPPDQTNRTGLRDFGVENFCNKKKSISHCGRSTKDSKRRKPIFVDEDCGMSVKTHVGIIETFSATKEKHTYLPCATARLLSVKCLLTAYSARFNHS